MAYTKTDWTEATPITAQLLNKMEQGIKDAETEASKKLPLSGGTITGTISSPLTTSTHLAGNKGAAIINSTASGADYTMLAKMNSTNGVWTLGNYNGAFNFYYTSNDMINAGQNGTTKTLALLDESGNSAFPGLVSAAAAVLSGALTVSGDTTLSGNLGLNSGRIYMTCGNGGAEGRFELNVPGSHSAGVYGNTSSFGLFDWTKNFSIFRYDRANSAITIGGKKPVLMMSGQGNNEIWWGTEATRPGSGIQFCW